ncbi:MAG: hypothetical protein ACR2NR_09890 [Solirubrobacteraceae bacterium]
MAVSDQLSRATPYIQRLLNDDYIQDQIGQGITALRASRNRTKGRKAQEALKDRRLWSQVQQAAGSLSQAVRALNEPEPPQHRARRTLLLAAAAGAGAYAWQQHSA